jgi:hypothetical protein
MMLSFTHTSEEAKIVKTFQKSGYNVISNTVSFDSFDDPWYTITFDAQPMPNLDILFSTLAYDMNIWHPNHSFTTPHKLREGLDNLIKYYSCWDALEENISKDNFVDFLVLILQARQAFDDNIITQHHIKLYTTVQHL